MKKFFLVMVYFFLSGCVSTIVTKEIQVRKDADGKILETLEIERTTQQGVTKGGVELQHLKAKQSDSVPVNVYY